MRVNKKGNTNKNGKSHNKKTKNKATLGRELFNKIKSFGLGLKENITNFTNKLKALGESKRNRFIAAGVSATIVVATLGSMALGNIQSEKKMQQAHLLEVKIPSLEDFLSFNYGTEKISDTYFTEIPVKSLKVDDKIIANFKTEEEAIDILEQLKSKYQREDSELLDVFFKEDVVVSTQKIDVTRFEGFDVAEEVIAFIEKGTDEERTHTVEKGENYWIIGQMYGVDPEDLEAANPGVNPTTIQIGQVISLIVPTPIINVVTTEQITYTDNIAFETKYEETGNLYKGESRIKVAGVYGEKSVVAKLFRENGREVRREVISEKITKEPTTRIVYNGTKNPPPRVGTGSFIRPVKGGIVTSEYGPRWGTRHTGIDLGIPVGTPIYAADGGVVKFAGYSSGYGYHVIIDHGANTVTYYAHNSQNLVSKGDKVFQGQLIAYSGSTGYSTGPHLHFEVRINNSPSNPRNFLNF